MSNRLITAAWKTKGLSCTEKCVLVNLADRADKQDTCFPGHDLIATDCGLSDRSVRAVIHSLQSKGQITTKRAARHSYKGGSLFKYHVHPTPEAVSGVTPEAGALHTGKGRTPHRKITYATPEAGAGTIYGTQRNQFNPNRNPEAVLENALPALPEGL